MSNTSPFLEVLTAPDPILNKKALPVPEVDDSVRSLMDSMLKTMYRENGSGLAANQVGVLKRILVMDLENDDETKREKGFYPLCMANPSITGFSEEMVEAVERCISVPDQGVKVSRCLWVEVSYIDYHNNIRKLRADNWLARVIQHEMDHLDGKLLLDYLSGLKKSVVNRRLIKLKKHRM